MNKCKFNRLSVFVNCSPGSTPTVKSLKKFIDLISEMGYNELYLGLNYGYTVEGEPYFGYMIGHYNTDELKEIDEYASLHGIEVIAQIHVLGHMDLLKKQYCYNDLFENKSNFLVDDERVYQLAEKMIASIRKGLKTNKIHLGFDETYGLGHGRYREIHGDADTKDLILRHLARCNEIAKKYNYKVQIWGDMLVSEKRSKLTHEEVKARIPDDVEVIYWEYFQFDEDVIDKNLTAFKQQASNVAYCGAAWKIAGFAPINDYGIKRLIPQMRVCHKKGFPHFIISLWSDSGAQASIFSVLPTLFVASEFAYGRIQSADEIDKSRFKEITGVDYDVFHSLDYLNNPFKNNKCDMSTRSMWLMICDLFLSNLYLMQSDGYSKQYAQLEKEYLNADGGEFQRLFYMQSKAAGIIALRAELPRTIHEAYKAKDKAQLKEVINKRIPELKNRVTEFIKVFSDYYLAENKPYGGLEYNHLLLGGSLARYDYVSDRLKQFIECNEPIDELEQEVLMPSNMEPTEDRYCDNNFFNYITFANNI